MRWESSSGEMAASTGHVRFEMLSILNDDCSMLLPNCRLLEGAVFVFLLRFGTSGSVLRLAGFGDMF